MDPFSVNAAEASLNGMTEEFAAAFAPRA